MDTTTLLLILLSFTEIALLAAVVVFFLRLKKSEDIISQLSARQEDFLNKLRFNTQLEQEMVQSFGRRQEELARLEGLLSDREQQLKKLLKQAEEFSCSPQFLRQIILDGHRQGKSAAAMARSTGLSAEEVELILEQAR